MAIVIQKLDKISDLNCQFFFFMNQQGISFTQRKKKSIFFIVIHINVDF